jgi:YesN/AraC family two-component response regulator
LSAAAGYVIDNSDQLNGMYGDTLNILMYRIKYGRSCIIFPSILNQINSDNFQFPASKEKILMDSLKLGDFERAKNAYFEIVSIISSYSYDNIMASIIYLTFTVYNSLNNIMANRSVRFSAIFNTFLSHIGNLETLDEINQMFVNLFEEIIGKLNKAKGKKSDSIVNNVIRLINNSYYNKNLCLNSIADFMAMSPVYLGKLFKDVTSKSVAEYIMDLRMEKVKQLLDTGNLSTNEILDKSGLEKTNYFYTTFKKHFGVSLGDYKLQQRGVNKNG